MEYQLALSPDLDLDPDSFVEAWNADAECRAAAEARLEATPASYDLGTAAAVILGVGTGMAANAFWDLIKTFIEGRVRRRTEITQLERPDGTRVLVVRIEEGG